MLGDDLLALLGPSVPRDNAAQTLADTLVGRWYPQLAAQHGRPLRVVDLGCGTGDSIELFRALDPAVNWLGVDIADSPEVRSRRRDDARFATFDGVELPLESGSVDLIFCKQVLEHVGDPGRLLCDAGRVLREGGALVGSTSQLEPYHSLSTFGYTPHGLSLLLDRAGLRTRELRPGIDALTLLARRALGMPRVFDRYWSRPSPLNRAIDLLARARRADAGWANAAKLVFCGQFAFAATKDAAAG